MNTYEKREKMVKDICVVTPRNINKELFAEKRKKPREENIRLLILEGLEKKSEEFCVIIPNKVEGYKTQYGLKTLAKELGDRMGNVVEWALYCAQRITNGESWTEATTISKEMNLLLENQEGNLITISNRFANLAEIGMNASGISYPYWEPTRTVPFVVFYR